MELNTYLLEALFHAWNALKNGKSSKSIRAFDLHHEHEIIQLAEEIQSQTYAPSPYRCFIIHDPVCREIFAARVRDRIIHHLIHTIINPFFEHCFITDSYACRVWKGTHFGINRLQHHIRSCSQNYTADCFVLKLDIQWFFMAIDKNILRTIIEKQLTKHRQYRNQQAPFLTRAYGLQLIHTILFFDPTKHFTRLWLASDRDELPSDKSLFHSPPDIWLPLGNLTSQLFANIYLHQMDLFIKHTCTIKHYGRYMDDFYLIHHDLHYLQDCLRSIKSFLSDRLHLTLHPRKIYLQHYTKWVQFCGAIIKPYRTYVKKKTLGRFRQKINTLTPVDVATHEKLQKVICTINSYLGICQHVDSYKIRKKIVNSFPTFLSNKIIQKNHYTKVVPRTRKMRSAELKKYKDFFRLL